MRIRLLREARPRRALTRSGSVLALVAALPLACGSESSSEPPRSEGDAGVFSLPDPKLTDACITSTVDGELEPANLIFMLDKSGSMGQPPDFDPALKWSPVTSGLSAFFADGASAGMRASLHVFPKGATIQEECTATYADPLVALRDLPEPAAFSDAIANVSPSGGTPTLPALAGAADAARAAKAVHPNERTVIVLVTDGEPGYRINGMNTTGCGDPSWDASGQPPNDIANVASLAASLLADQPPINTYVIGVGDALNNLDSIARAGGTGRALLVSAQMPSRTAEELRDALSYVRNSTLACAFPVPSPPDGRKLDLGRVNVVVRVDGREETLSYSDQCAAAEGWRYDQIDAPSRIELCSAACARVKADVSTIVTIAFGCGTKGGIR